MGVFRKFSGIVTDQVFIDPADLPIGGPTDTLEVAGPITSTGSITSTGINNLGGITLKTIVIVNPPTAIFAAGVEPVIICDAITGIITVDLPVAPVDGQVYYITRINANPQNVIINGNGKNIDGAGTATISIQWKTAIIIYVAANNQWYNLNGEF